MDLLGHDFFVFVNAENRNASVLYRCNDGDFGLIEAVGLTNRPDGVGDHDVVVVEEDTQPGRAQHDRARAGRLGLVLELATVDGEPRHPRRIALVLAVTPQVALLEGVGEEEDRIRCVRWEKARRWP